MKVGVEWVALHTRARVPRKAYPGDAGWDLAVLDTTTVSPGSTEPLRTGVVAVLPAGWWWLMVQRSSSPLEVRLAVIDAGYQGELIVVVSNRTSLPVTVREGDRVSQLVPMPVADLEWRRAAHMYDLSHTPRGDRGFGSSGRG